MQKTFKASRVMFQNVGITIRVQKEIRITDENVKNCEMAHLIPVETA